MLFDIGANCGKYTNANIDKYSKVICVDASALQCELLKKNVSPDKCTIIQTLVSSDDTAKFYRCNESGISSASFEWMSGKGRFAPGNKYYAPYLQWTLEPATITSLDRLIETYGTPSFIKIDVEGHELEVVKSLTTKYSGTIAFEWSEEMNTEAIETINYIYDVLGHTKFYIQLEDSYTFVPDETSYTTKEEIIDTINTTWVPTRHELWGMIWSK